ncbi:MAG TPA: hypothetical protein VIM35_06965 [Gallionella sp.]
MGVLKKVIDEGGVPMGGMPGFNDELKEDEKLAVIFCSQSFWPDEIYNAWLTQGGLKQGESDSFSRLAVDQRMFGLTLELAKIDSISLKGFRKYVLRDSYD